MQPKPLEPREIKDQPPSEAVLQHLTAAPQENIEIMKPDEVGMSRNVQKVTNRDIRSMPQVEPKSISVDVTSVSEFKFLLWCLKKYILLIGNRLFD